VKRDSLPALLSQIQALVEECIRLAGKSGNSQSRRAAAPVEKAVKGALPERILDLRDKGFFSKSKTGNEVQAKLNPTYSCEVDRVLMALLRLAKRRKLRKASKTIDGKKQVAYVW
jgi:hypothetical protein